MFMMKMMMILVTEIRLLLSRLQLSGVPHASQSYRLPARDPWGSATGCRPAKHHLISTAKMCNA